MCTRNERNVVNRGLALNLSGMKRISVSGPIYFFRFMSGTNSDASSIKFMRVSSEMFPFASHPKYGYNLAFADEELKVSITLSVYYAYLVSSHKFRVSDDSPIRSGIASPLTRGNSRNWEVLRKMS